MASPSDVTSTDGDGSAARNPEADNYEPLTIVGSGESSTRSHRTRNKNWWSGFYRDDTYEYFPIEPASPVRLNGRQANQPEKEARRKKIPVRGTSAKSLSSVAVVPEDPHEVVIVSEDVLVVEHEVETTTIEQSTHFETCVEESPSASSSSVVVSGGRRGKVKRASKKETVDVEWDDSSVKRSLASSEKSSMANRKLDGVTNGRSKRQRSKPLRYLSPSSSPTASFVNDSDESWSEPDWHDAQYDSDFKDPTCCGSAKKSATRPKGSFGERRTSLRKSAGKRVFADWSSDDDWDEEPTVRRTVKRAKLKRTGSLSKLMDDTVEMCMPNEPTAEIVPPQKEEKDENGNQELENCTELVVAKRSRGRPRKVPLVDDGVPTLLLNEKRKPGLPSKICPPTAEELETSVAQMPWQEDERGLTCLKCNVRVDSAGALIAHLNVHCRNGYRFPGDLCKTLRVVVPKVIVAPEPEMIEEILQDYLEEEAAVEQISTPEASEPPTDELFVENLNLQRPTKAKPLAKSTMSKKSRFLAKIAEEMDVEDVGEDERKLIQERLTQRQFLRKISSFKPDGYVDRPLMMARNRELKKLEWILDPYHCEGSMELDMDAEKQPPVMQKPAKRAEYARESKSKNAKQEPFAIVAPEWPAIPLCSSCGSKGVDHNLVNCYICCERFHWFCAVPPVSLDQRRLGVFICADCAMCFECGETGNVELSCAGCLKSYHDRCAPMQLPDILICDEVKGSGDERGDQLDKPRVGWYCLECTPCQSCGGASGLAAEFIVEGRTYVCEECRRLFDALSLCQICMKADDPSCWYYDLSSPEGKLGLDDCAEILRCSECEGKVHARCELLSSDEALKVKEEEHYRFQCSCCDFESLIRAKKLNVDIGRCFSTSLAEFVADVARNARLPPDLRSVITPLLPWRAALSNSLGRAFEQSLRDLESRWRQDQKTDLNEYLSGAITSFRNDVYSYKFPSIASFCERFVHVLDSGNISCEEIERELERWFPHHVYWKRAQRYRLKAAERPAGKPPTHDHEYSVRGGSKKVVKDNCDFEKSEDTRECALCPQKGDSAVAERLVYVGMIPSDDSNPSSLVCWAHLNCVLWCPGVRKRSTSKGMVLSCVKDAVQSGLKASKQCCCCGGSGATIKCRGGKGLCEEVLHFPCAVKKCAVLAVDVVCCPKHVGAVPENSKMRDFKLERRVVIDGANEFVDWPSSTTSYDILTGSVKYHIRPDGLEITRWYWSFLNPVKAVAYSVFIRLLPADPQLVLDTFRGSEIPPLLEGSVFSGDLCEERPPAVVDDGWLAGKALEAFEAVVSSGWVPDHSKKAAFQNRLYRLPKKDLGFLARAEPEEVRDSVFLVFSGGVRPGHLREKLSDEDLLDMNLCPKKTRRCLKVAEEFFTVCLQETKFQVFAEEEDDEDEVITDLEIMQLDGMDDEDGGMAQQFVPESSFQQCQSLPQQQRVIHFTPANISPAPQYYHPSNNVLLIDLQGCTNPPQTSVMQTVERVLGSSARFLGSVDNQAFIPAPSIPQPTQTVLVMQQPQVQTVQQVVPAPLFAPYRYLTGTDGIVYGQYTIDIPQPLQYQLIGVPSMQPVSVPQVVWQDSAQNIQLVSPQFTQVPQMVQQPLMQHFSQPMQAQFVPQLQIQQEIPQIVQQQATHQVQPASVEQEVAGEGNSVSQKDVTGENVAGPAPSPAEKTSGMSTPDNNWSFSIYEPSGQTPRPLESDAKEGNSTPEPEVIVIEHVTNEPEQNGKEKTSTEAENPDEIGPRFPEPMDVPATFALRSLEPLPLPSTCTLTKLPTAMIKPTPRNKDIVEAVLKRLAGKPETSEPNEVSSSSSSCPVVPVVVDLEQEGPPVKKDRLLDSYRSYMKKRSGNRPRPQFKFEPLTLSSGGKMGEESRVISVALDKENSNPVIYELKAEDGTVFQGDSLEKVWTSMVEAVQQARKKEGLPLLPCASLSNMCKKGIDHSALNKLISLLPVQDRQRTRFVFQLLKEGKKEEPKPEGGCARTDGLFAKDYDPTKRRPRDMFSFLTSLHRPRPLPELPPDTMEATIVAERKPKKLSRNLPLISRYLAMKENGDVLYVHRSRIHGRGLFTTRAFEVGDLLVEYLGEYVRSCVADKREKQYTSQGLGCYMFRVDDEFVLDATRRGNYARFINHSCEPNCHSKVATLLGKKRILIFALKDIGVGEELTYNYKFPPDENDRLPCLCRSAKCRKFLN